MYHNNIVIVFELKLLGKELVQGQDTQTLLCPAEIRKQISHMKDTPQPIKKGKDILITRERNFKTEKAIEKNLVKFLLIYYLSTNST